MWYLKLHLLATLPFTLGDLPLKVGAFSEVASVENRYAHLGRVRTSVGAYLNVELPMGFLLQVGYRTANSASPVEVVDRPGLYYGVIMSDF